MDCWSKWSAKWSLNSEKVNQRVIEGLFNIYFWQEFGAQKSTWFQEKDRQPNRKISKAWTGTSQNRISKITKKQTWQGTHLNKGKEKKFS